MDKPIIQADTSAAIHDDQGRVMVPAALLKHGDSRLTTTKLWVQLAEMLPVGQDTLTFDSVADLADKLGYPNVPSIYPQIKRLEDLGWISRSRGINAHYSRLTIQLLPAGKS